MKRLILTGAAMMMMATAAHAETPKTITCTGTLIDVWLKPKAEWPLAVIYDAAGGYACTVDRTGSGHDPLRSCSVGEKCRITGTYRTPGIGEPKTYSIHNVRKIEYAE
jgi:hypothetical protein